MSKARHPKRYKQGERKQMTPAWKQRVLDRLTENESKDVAPRNLAELARMLNGGKGADKRGIYVTFDLEADKPQTASAYVVEICEILDLPMPLQEAVSDEELDNDVAFLKAMPPEVRRDLMAAARRMYRKNTE